MGGPGCAAKCDYQRVRLQIGMLMAFRRKKTVFAALIIFSALFFLYRELFPTAKDVLADFYRPGSETGRREEMLTNPLKAHADTVKMLVIEKIPDKRMPNRRYAIFFLGDCRIQEAIPALQAILNDKTENAGIRGDALRSIFFIDRDMGLALAEVYNAGNDLLQYSAKTILSGQVTWTDPDERPSEIVNECVYR